MEHLCARLEHRSYKGFIESARSSCHSGRNAKKCYQPWLAVLPVVACTCNSLWKHTASQDWQHFFALRPEWQELRAHPIKPLHERCSRVHTDAPWEPCRAVPNELPKNCSRLVDNWFYMIRVVISGYLWIPIVVLFLRFHQTLQSFSYLTFAGGSHWFHWNLTNW